MTRAVCVLLCGLAGAVALQAQTGAPRDPVAPRWAIMRREPLEGISQVRLKVNLSEPSPCVRTKTPIEAAMMSALRNFDVLLTTDLDAPLVSVSVMDLDTSYECIGSVAVKVTSRALTGLPIHFTSDTSSFPKQTTLDDGEALIYSTASIESGSDTKFGEEIAYTVEQIGYKIGTAIREASSRRRANEPSNPDGFWEPRLSSRPSPLSGLTDIRLNVLGSKQCHPGEEKLTSALTSAVQKAGFSVTQNAVSPELTVIFIGLLTGYNVRCSVYTEVRLRLNGLSILPMQQSTNLLEDWPKGILSTPAGSRTPVGFVSAQLELSARDSLIADNASRISGGIIEEAARLAHNVLTTMRAANPQR